MAIYTYRCEAGDEFEVEVPMTKAPKVGHRRYRGGVEYRRVLEVPGIAIKELTGSTSLTGWNLPTMEKHNAEERALVDGWTPTGHPRFNNRAQAQKWCAVGRKRSEKNGGGQFYDVGISGEDAPGGKEVSLETAAGRLIKE